MRRIRLTGLLLLSMVFELSAQGSQSVEMADVLRSSGKIYSVVFGILVILVGFVVFLVRVDRRIRRLEQEMVDTPTKAQE